MSDTTTTQTGPDQTPKPRKHHRVRNTFLVLCAAGLIGGIASAASGGSHPAAAPAKPQLSATQPTTQGCKALLHWENTYDGPDTSYTSPAVKALIAQADGTKFASDMRAWNKAGSAADVNGSLAEAAKIHADCAAVGVDVLGSQSTTPASSAPAAPATTAPAAPAPATTAPAAPATTAPAAPAPATTAPAAPATTAPAAPAGRTASQQQALDAAQNYLSDGQGFSRAGLIQQLTSQYGNGFSQADATWAVDNSGADWDAQATTAAKNYMSDGQGFSRDSLIAQLDSPYGSQFTYAQAVYAAGQVGL